MVKLLGGDHIRVEVFEDRLEVESQGRLPGLVRVDKIRSTRFARNPRIARSYEVPIAAGPATVAVKITDMLGEELLVTREV